MKNNERTPADCSRCKHAERLPRGAYSILNGNLIVRSGSSFFCSNNGSMDISFANGDMRCSRFEEKEDAE